MVIPVCTRRKVEGGHKKNQVTQWKANKQVTCFGHWGSIPLGPSETALVQHMPELYLRSSKPGFYPLASVPHKRRVTFLCLK